MKQACLASTALIALALCGARPSAADPRPPQPQSMPPAVPAPKDVSWPGSIGLAVDETDLDRHIVSVHEHIPVQKPGDLVLLYPRWVPGDHGPTGPLADLAGLTVTADGKPLDWRRDAVGGARLPRHCPGGRERARCALPVSLAGRHRRGPGRDDTGHDRPRLEHRAALPGRRVQPGHHDGADPDPAERLGNTRPRWRR